MTDANRQYEDMILQAQRRESGKIGFWARLWYWLEEHT